MNNELGIRNYKIVILTSCFLVFLFSCFFTLTAARAVDVGTQLDAFAGSRGAGVAPAAGAQDPRLVIARVIQGALGLVGTLFLAYTVYAGYLIMTARGEEDQINKGKATIRTAVIGILVTLSAYGIVQFVTDSLLVTTGAVDQGDVQIYQNDPRDQMRYDNRDPFNAVNNTPGF